MVGLKIEIPLNVAIILLIHFYRTKRKHRTTSMIGNFNNYGVR